MSEAKNVEEQLSTTQEGQSLTGGDPGQTGDPSKGAFTTPLKGGDSGQIGGPGKGAFTTPLGQPKSED